MNTEIYYFSGTGNSLFIAKEAQKRIPDSEILPIACLLAERWNNGSCHGYVIYAIENCGFTPDDIQRVVSELHYVFDMKSLKEADEHYCNSPY